MPRTPPIRRSLLADELLDGLPRLFNAAQQRVPTIRLHLTHQRFDLPQIIQECFPEPGCSEIGVRPQQRFHIRHVDSAEVQRVGFHLTAPERIHLFVGLRHPNEEGNHQGFILPVVDQELVGAGGISAGEPLAASLFLVAGECLKGGCPIRQQQHVDPVVFPYGFFPAPGPLGEY